MGDKDNKHEEDTDCTDEQGGGSSKLKNSILAFVFGLAVLSLAACNSDQNLTVGQDALTTIEPITEAQSESGEGIASASDSNCDKFQSVLAPYANLVSVDCDDEWVYVESASGQPEHEMMAGITAWILRFPLPYPYEGETAWRFPLEPTWLDEHEATHARGPLAMAVNGVPIYHFDKRPDVSLDESYIYDALFDTVMQGELDHCGGHAGQGEDYHYHLAPICLLDAHDLDLAIAFTLGGAQIFYGTGADDYYGYGRYSGINNLPDEPLDECNAIQLADGSYVYYTTNEPPYILGCHHEEVDWSLQIEAREMRPLGEFGRNAVELLSFSILDGVRTLLFETDSGDINAIVVTPSASGEGCWDFEFRTDIDVAVTPETHCRIYDQPPTTDQ